MALDGSFLGFAANYATFGWFGVHLDFRLRAVDCCAWHHAGGTRRAENE